MWLCYESISTRVRQQNGKVSIKISTQWQYFNPVMQQKKVELCIKLIWPELKLINFKVQLAFTSCGCHSNRCFSLVYSIQLWVSLTVFLMILLRTPSVAVHFPQCNDMLDSIEPFQFELGPWYGWEKYLGSYSKNVHRKQVSIGHHRSYVAVWGLLK